MIICQFGRYRLQSYVPLYYLNSVYLNHSGLPWNIQSTCNSNNLRSLCTTSNKRTEIFTKHKDKVKEEFKLYIEQNREKLRETEEKLKRRRNLILKNIRDTKNKVKEKVEEIIEVGEYGF